MDKTEAAQVADARLTELRQVPYSLLVEEWLNQPRSESALAPSGREYQLEIEAVWDDRSEGRLRVRVLVDDGGWRTSFPLARAFITAPDGSFIDEVVHAASRQKQRPDLAGRRGGSLRFEGAALDGGTSRPCGPSCSCRDEPGGMPARGEVSF